MFKRLNPVISCTLFSLKGLLKSSPRLRKMKQVRWGACTHSSKVANHDLHELVVAFKKGCVTVKSRRDLERVGGCSSWAEEAQATHRYITKNPHELHSNLGMELRHSSLVSLQISKGVE